MKYQILQSTELQLFINGVNKAMEDGWEPLGGLAVGSHETNGSQPNSVVTVFTYMQAMTKK